MPGEYDGLQIGDLPPLALYALGADVPAAMDAKVRTVWLIRRHQSCTLIWIYWLMRYLDR
ncbi:MAG: hypothetical protein M9918_11185 [Anaerolineae bacterium]|nr:hypothetical protein [Anaerolineae bacterium]